MLASNQIVMIAGNTGCGKSTQVPQYILEHAWGRCCCAAAHRSTHFWQIADKTVRLLGTPDTAAVNWHDLA